MFSHHFLSAFKERLDLGKRKPILLLIWGAVLFGTLTLAARHVWADRPFISTRAEVVGQHKTELELGLFDLSNEGGKNEILFPRIRLNYGIVKRWEVGLEGDLQIYKGGKERHVELQEPGVFLRGVVREGVLQNKKGPSLAVEMSTLFPSTAKGERKAGLEGAGIFSWKLSNLVFHVNGGAEFDREGFDLNGIWGTILEYPFQGKFRLVGELNGRFKHEDSPDNSGLIGFIWEIGKVDLDFGARMGFSDAAPDWALTTGITFGF